MVPQGTCSGLQPVFPPSFQAGAASYKLLRIKMEIKGQRFSLSPASDNHLPSYKQCAFQRELCCEGALHPIRGVDIFSPPITRAANSLSSPNHNFFFANSSPSRVLMCSRCIPVYTVSVMPTILAHPASNPPLPFLALRFCGPRWQRVVQLGPSLPLGRPLSPSRTCSGPAFALPWQRISSLAADVQRQQ
jgi:hypothetical protein